MVRENKTIQVLGVSVILVAIYQLIKNLPQNVTQSAFSFGEFFAAQPAIFKIIAFWFVALLVGVVVLFYASPGMKKK